MGTVFDTDGVGQTKWPSTILQPCGVITPPTALNAIASLNTLGTDGKIVLLHQAMQRGEFDACDLYIEGKGAGSIEAHLYKVPDGVDIDTAVGSEANRLSSLRWAIGESGSRKRFTMRPNNRDARHLVAGDKVVMIVQSYEDVYYYGYTGAVGYGNNYGSTNFERGTWAAVIRTY